MCNLLGRRGACRIGGVMKRIGLIGVGLFLCIMLSRAAAQGSARPVITPQNAAQVELLAVGGWNDGFQSLEVDAELGGRSAATWWPAWVIAFNPEGTRFALGNDNNEVVLFDVIDEPPFIVENRVLRAHAGPVYSLAFHPNGRQLASGGSDGMIYVWDLDTGEIAETIAVYEPSAVYGLAYSPDGAELYCATFLGLGQVRQYGDGPRCYRRGSENSDPVYSVAFSPDGSLLVYGDTVFENQGHWALSLSVEMWRGWSDSYKSSRTKLTFSTDGRVLLNAGTNQLPFIWHMDDLSHGIMIDGDSLLALSPDGSLVAGGNLLIHETETGAQLLSLASPEARFPTDAYHANLSRDAVFSPDGTLIVTASVDGLLRFWGIPAS